MSLKFSFIDLDRKNHDRKSFYCGLDNLDSFFKKVASQQMKKNLNKTKVLIDPASENPQKTIIAYFTFTPVEIATSSLPKEDTKGLPTNKKVPTFLLARLAVDKNYQGKGYGKITLINALYYLVKVSENMPAYGIVVDPVNSKAEKFYTKYGFKDLKTKSGEKRLFIATKTLQELFKNENAFNR